VLRCKADASGNCHVHFKSANFIASLTDLEHRKVGNWVHFTLAPYKTVLS
jgi:hypothetical protein